MSRPTKIVIDSSALLHNLAQVKRYAPGKKVTAMVKANAYGCGLSAVVPILEGQVDAFGVACLEEALAIRALGSTTLCLLAQGVFSQEEFHRAAVHHCACVLHHPQQLEWLLSTALAKPLSIWIKLDTGMHRLGFKPHELPAVVEALRLCPWVDKEIGLMTHLACADEPSRPENLQQIAAFDSIQLPGLSQRSMANSAALIALPQTHADVVRPGIMLYGVSPFSEKTSLELGLRPVMRFSSALSAIYHYPPFASVGYGATWHSEKASIIGIVAVGYGDGYPRHIGIGTPVFIEGQEVPIVGRVSMDMLAVDLTEVPAARIGDSVELWGTNVLVERVAQSAGTIGYELLCQITDRARVK
jgi:alanine racemase